MDMNTKDLFEKNMSYFEKNMPDLHARAAAFTPESKLVFDDGGDPDLEIQGERLYGMGARKLVEKQMDRFRNSDTRLKISPISSGNVDSESNKFLYNIMERAVDADITFDKWNRSENSYHALSLGCGLGIHLDILAKETQCQNMIVAEPNFEFFYQSLHCFDWADFVTGLLNEGRKFQIIFENNSEDMIARLRSIITNTNPVSYDGLRIFIHYEHPILRKTNNFLKDDSRVLLQGWGFFEDEVNIIANSYMNLSSGKEILYQRKDAKPNIPIFIIGSGPSLDDHLEIIRENSEKAIIVSCGTALRPLMTAGIVPDFHMEMERGPYIVNVITELSTIVDLSKVILFASTTCQPKFQEFFPNRVYYFRRPMSCFPLFGKTADSCIRFASPTVTNVGLSFAQDLGFREYYFFGIDLGAKDKSRHHSKNTYYYAKSKDLSLAWSDKLKGNFGGTVFSTNILSWTKNSLEDAIRFFSRGHRYYNCSDGAAIKGALPKLVSTLSLEEPRIDKQEIIKAILDGLPVYSSKDLQDRWNAEELIDRINESIHAAKEILENSPGLKNKKYLTDMMNFLELHQHNDPTRMLFGGSMAVALMTGEYYLDRVMEAEMFSLMETIVKDEYLNMLESMKNQAIAEIRSIDTGKRFEGSLIYYDE